MNMSQSIPSGTTEVLQKKAQQPRTAPLLVRLFPFIRAHFGKFLALLIIMAISSIIGLLPPLFMGIAIDQYLVKPNLKGVLIICIMIILYGAIEALLVSWERTCANISATRSSWTCASRCTRT